MKKLGIFITTHMQRGYRHGGAMENKMFSYFRDQVIGKYQEYDSGLNDSYDIYICDTGSNDPMYLQWLYNITEEEERIQSIDIANKCGFAAAQKHLMHVDPGLADNYEYILFHVDDITYPSDNDWGKDLIDKWNQCDNLGIMGRYIDKIRLGPNGLVDHRNCCPHIGKMHGLTEIVTVPHLHAEYWLMDRETLSDIANVWWNPVASEEAMKYQKKWEETNFCTLADLPDRRKTLDDIHIGRETDMPLRMDLIGKRMASYKGTKFWPNYTTSYKSWDQHYKREVGEYKYEDS